VKLEALMLRIDQLTASNKPFQIEGLARPPHFKDHLVHLSLATEFVPSSSTNTTIVVISLLTGPDIDQELHL
jgi:hypothetical protein